MINSVFNMTIDGRPETSSDQIDVVNPATEAVVATIPDCSGEQLDRAVAAARANASEYGLGGSVWSSDPAAAAAVAARLETGTVWINSAQGLTPFAAFAGHKQSGIGAEDGLEGVLEFTVPQTIHHPA